jgi:hypothetical protein
MTGLAERICPIALLRFRGPGLYAMKKDRPVKSVLSRADLGCVPFRSWPSVRLTSK